MLDGNDLINSLQNNYGRPSREDNHAVDISPTVAQPRALSSSAGSIGTLLTAKASTSFSTPETFRGYPKAGPRSTSTKGRKRGRAMVAISTPEMAIIKKQHMVKMNAKQGSSKAVTNKTAKAKATAKTHTVKRTILIEPGEEESDSLDHTFCNELSDGEDGGKPPIGQTSSGEGNPSRSEWHRNDAPHQERHCLQRDIWKLEIVLVLYARITSSTHYLN